MKTFYSFRSFSTCVASILTILFCAYMFGSPEATAQQDVTFQVSVATKDASHPNFNQGWPVGYVVDGVQGKELTLVRGTRYIFQMNDVPSDHPFYISTSEVGAGEAPLNDEGITNQMVTGNGALSFTPNQSTPALLYYQCGHHPRMGWKINVVDGPVGSVQSPRESSMMLSLPAPNPTADASAFSLMLPVRQAVRITLHDVAGQQVQLLHEGMLDAGSPYSFTVDAAGLGAGLYHVHVVGETFATGRSVVVVK